MSAWIQLPAQSAPPARPETARSDSRAPAGPEGLFRSLLEGMKAGQSARTPGAPAPGESPGGPPAEATPNGVPFQAGLPRPLGKGGVPAALAALLTPAPVEPPPAAPLPVETAPEEPLTEAPISAEPEHPVPALPAEAAPQPQLPVDPLLLAQAVQAQMVQVRAPAADTPQTDDEQTRTLPAPTATSVAEADEARLEHFVRAAAAHVAAGEKAEGEAPAAKSGTTFGELVKLAVQAVREQQPGRPESDTRTPPAHAGAHPNAGTNGQGSAAGQPQILPVAPEPGQGAEPATPAEPKEAGPQGVAAGFDKTSAAERLNLEAEAPAPERPHQFEEQIVRQTVKFVKLMADSRQTEVHLRLHPEHLGQVAVRLLMENGAVKANLVAQDAAVKAVLETNLDQLRTRLQEQGIPVTQVDVAVGSGSEFSQPRQGQQSGHGQQTGQGRPHHMQQLREEEPELFGQPRRETPSWARNSTGSRLNALA